MVIQLIKSEDLGDELLRQIINRGLLGFESVEKDVIKILEEIRTRGDEALFEFTERFDGVKLDSKTIRAEQNDFRSAYNSVKPVEARALKKAAANIERFHKIQLDRLEFSKSGSGITLGSVFRPLSSVGIYAPGGKTSYPSSVLMCAIPAKVAGVERMVICSPPSLKWRFNPHILVASDIAGIDEVFCVGGAQAIAAMAYGTKTIGPVRKIVGPGNLYVTSAKQLLSRHIAVDLPAGPSEILIIADDKANPEFITGDLLAQAEHDENAFCILLTDSERIANKVKTELEMSFKNAPLNSVSRMALEKRGLIILVKNLQEAVKIANDIAPEHLMIMTNAPKMIFKKIMNAGLIFMGQYSPVALGDYTAGTNHVLPTGGYARTYSGLSVRDYIKTISFVQCTKNGLKRLAEPTMTLAKIEKMQAHSRSIEIRGV